MSEFASNHRNDETARLVAQWWRENQLGRAAPVEELVAQHAELMPELLAHVRLLQGMRAAQEPDSGSVAKMPQSTGFRADESEVASRPFRAQYRTIEPVAARTAELIAGAILDQRYVICHRIGQGGMGTVYLAEDRSLAKLVAIKTFDGGFTAKYRDQIVSEALLAHRVTHINVCRIHDIKLEHEPAFLTMEYIDGEDLDQTLLRIGRFVPERALQVSLEICLGLAAAHQQGVIHRDIKPRNIMLDSTGMVRITDFGLARTSYSDEQSIAGTLAYMAPEQRQGRGTSELSDIYSLGSVLHEIYTGKPPQRLGSRSRSTKKQSWLPPSFLLPEIDPQVERTILRCLELDPKDRPQSVLAVCDGLQGVDKLNALVAAAEGASREPLRWMTIAALVGLALCWVLSGYRAIEHVDFEIGGYPISGLESYKVQAAEWIEELGYKAKEQSDHRAHGFVRPGPFVNELSKAGQPIVYWYRQADQPLAPTQLLLLRNQKTSAVKQDDPYWDRPGMVGVRSTVAGHLLEFCCVPSIAPPEQPEQPQSLTAASSEVPLALRNELKTLFRYAELTYEDFVGTTTETGRELLRGLGPLQPKLEFVTAKLGGEYPRVLVDTDRDRVTHFRVIYPSDIVASGGERRTLGAVLDDVLFVVIVLGAMTGFVLARRNSREQELDSHAAKATAAIVFCSMLLSFFFSASHTYDLHQERLLCERSILNAVFWTALLWVLYMSLEPFVRREHPQALRDWLLLMHGEFRRSSVALRIVGGAMLAILLTPLLLAAHAELREQFGLPARYGIPPIEVTAIEDLRGLAAAHCDALVNSIYSAFAIVLLPMLLNKVFRNFRVAVGVTWGINSIFYGSFFGASIEPWWDFGLFTLYMSLWAALHLWVTLRGGVLAGISHLWISSIIFYTPFTLTDRWYIDGAITSTTVLALALVAYTVWVNYQRPQPRYAMRG